MSLDQGIMSSQPPLQCLCGREVFEISGRVYGWEQVFLWAMVRSDWDRLLDRFRLTLSDANAFRAAGRKIASSHVQEAAEAFRYAHRLETAAAMRHWLRYWRLTPERWRQAVLLQAVQSRLTDADKSSFANDVRPKECQISRWLRPLGVVSGAFQALAQDLAGHAAIYDSLRSNQAGSDRAIDHQLYARATTFLGLDADDLPGKAEHVLALEESIGQLRQSVANPDAIRRQIAGNPMVWTRIRYDFLTFTSAAAAREAADCIRLDGEKPEDVATRAGITMEQATRFYTELERPLAAVLLSAGTNEWNGPLEIAGRHQLFRIGGKSPPRADDATVVDHIALHLFTQTMEKERRERVHWLLPFWHG